MNTIGQKLQLSPDYTIKIQYNAHQDVLYVGLAIPGTSINVYKWQIMKLLYDANNNVTDVLWADGNKNFDNKWSVRGTYSYS